MIIDKQSESRIEARAPAKVNLRLEILGKRPDGFHEVRLFMVPIALFDKIIVEKRESGIEISCPGVEDGPGNLAWKAAELFFAESAIAGGARIEIEKDIPAQAGLGGGSSDAAATLEALDVLYRANLGEPRLRELAGRLGSDIPFFVGPPRAAWALGRGELIEPFGEQLPEMWLVLIHPGIGVSTPVAYKALGAAPIDESALTALRAESMNTRPPRALGGAPGAETGESFFLNDLEPPVFAHYPLIQDIKGMLQEAGAPLTLMSGSGSSVFGLCPDEESAQGVLKRARIPDSYFRRVVRVLIPASGGTG